MFAYTYDMLRNIRSDNVNTSKCKLTSRSNNLCGLGGWDYGGVGIERPTSVDARKQKHVRNGCSCMYVCMLHK